VALQRGADGSDPAGAHPVGGLREVGHHHLLERSSLLSSGTLACPVCDAPIAPPDDPLSVGERLECPYCAHRAFVRDFLSLGEPSRPARVEVRVARRRRAAARAT
jgi:DNA-directed RNA polymerase subunit RPC12/RpoP